jgi:hypothetical protein
MRIQINLAARTERVLRAKAVAAGRTLEALLEEIADREAATLHEGQDHPPSDLTEFEHGLDELSEGLPPLQTLPSDFSRGDIYGDHP